MFFAEKNIFLKILALILLVLCLVRPSVLMQIETPFEDFTSSSQREAPSSLAAIEVQMAFSRDTTFDALLKQELSTYKMCFHIIIAGLLSFLLVSVFSKIKYIHHTKMFRLLI